VIRWDCCEEGRIFTFTELRVRVLNRSDEESFAISVSSRRLPHEVTERIRKDLQNMLRESTKVDGLIDFVTLILCLMEAAGTDLLAWKDAVRSSKLEVGTRIKRWRHGWHARFVTDWESILDTPFGVNLDSIADTAYHILGKTPKEICAVIYRNPFEFSTWNRSSSGILQIGSWNIKTSCDDGFLVGHLRSCAPAYHDRKVDVLFLPMTKTSL
jgi:hypothetical protein